MTVCFPAYEKESTSSPGSKIRASWANNGIFYISVENSEQLAHCTLSVLPSELKQILEQGNFEGERSLRPCLFPYYGRIYSKKENENITITEEDELWEIKLKKNLTLYQDEWQELFDACVASRDKVVAEDFGGRMIQPIVGLTSFTEESKVC